MDKAKAILRNYRQSPRKVRLVADSVRGKKVAEAIGALSLLPKRSALPIKNLLESALSNAKSMSMSEGDLIVKEIRVDAGDTLFRRRARSHGMSNPIRKRTSHVSVTLSNSRSPKLELKAKI